MTVIQLRSSLAHSEDQVESIPPLLVQVRELKQENEVLLQQVEELKRQLEVKNTRPQSDGWRDTQPPLCNDQHFGGESDRLGIADVGSICVVCNPFASRVPLHTRRSS